LHRYGLRVANWRAGHVLNPPRRSSSLYYGIPVAEFQHRVEILFRNVTLSVILSGNPPVKRDHVPPAEGAASFHTTHWTVVLRAAQSQAFGAPSALAELFRLYWYPLYTFARRCGHSPDDSEDLTQSFFLHLIEDKTLIRAADPLKGKFRSFLLTSFKNYLCTEADRAHCVKRGGHCEFVSLDLENAENRYRLEPADALTAEKIFDARWALTLLGRTMTRLGEEYAAHGRASVFETLKVFLKTSGDGSPSYEEAAKALGVGLGAAKSLIHRLRKRCASILREEVARTVSDPDEIDDEIHALCSALIASGGSLDP
jgi:DNA-directed RNA polymerase specialized sigma24 family protein